MYNVLYICEVWMKISASIKLHIILALFTHAYTTCYTFVDEYLTSIIFGNIFAYEISVRI